VVRCSREGSITEMPTASSQPPAAAIFPPPLIRASHGGADAGCHLGPAGPTTRGAEGRVRSTTMACSLTPISPSEVSGYSPLGARPIRSGTRARWSSNRQTSHTPVSFPSPRSAIQKPPARTDPKPPDFFADSRGHSPRHYL
jgi:hypothetical protein